MLHATKRHLQFADTIEALSEDRGAAKQFLGELRALEGTDDPKLADMVRQVLAKVGGPPSSRKWDDLVAVLTNPYLDSELCDQFRTEFAALLD